MTDDVFLSAHCGTSRDDRCRWYDARDFLFWVDNKFGGAPLIWVSVSKHANFPSEDDCNSWYGTAIEECAPVGSPIRFPVTNIQQDIGSRSYPSRDCGGPFSASSLTDPGVEECLWSWEPPSCFAGVVVTRCNTPLQAFRGWQRENVGPAPMPYGQVLEQYAGF